MQRSGQAFLSDAAQLRLQAMSGGAEVPIDKLWLLQERDVLLEAPMNRAQIFAVSGERAGDDGQLLGYVAMASPKSPIVITREFPEEGRNFMHVGLSGDVGLRVGLNDAGIAMALLPEAGNASSSTTRFELARILAGATELGTAVGATKDLKAVDGAAVLILDRPVEAARYLDFKEYRRDKKPELASFLPETAAEVVSLAAVESMLSEVARGWLETSDLDGVAVPTVYAVVLSPASRSLHLAVSDGATFPENFQTFTIERGQP